MYFWLNYCDENHIERIPIAVKNISCLFHLPCQIIKADTLHLFLFSDGTRIHEDEYLESLENATELIVCTEEQIQKLLIYFELKRYLSLKNISYPLNIDYFLWHLPTAITNKKTGWLLFQNNFDVQFCRSSFKQYFLSSLVQSVFIVFPYDFEQAKHIQ